MLGRKKREFWKRRSRAQLTQFPSFEDRYFWEEHYWDDNEQLLEEYRQLQEDDVESKYPGWAAMSVSLTNMQSVIIFSS